MENDIKFLNEKLGKIDGYGDVGDKLLSIAKVKRADVEAAQGAVDARKAAEAIKAKEAAESAKVQEKTAQSNGTDEKGKNLEEDKGEDPAAAQEDEGAANSKN